MTDRIRDDGKQQRLCVLSRELCDHLLYCMDEVEDGGCHSEKAEGVTGEGNEMKFDRETGEVLGKAAA